MAERKRTRRATLADISLHRDIYEELVDERGFDPDLTDPDLKPIRDVYTETSTALAYEPQDWNATLDPVTP